MMTMVAMVVVVVVGVRGGRYKMQVGRIVVIS